jgi:hypothetical protein
VTILRPWNALGALAFVSGSLAILTTAAAAPVNVEDCKVFDPQWVRCHGYIALDGAAGLPDKAPFGIVSSAECGRLALAAPTDPALPAGADCWVWIGLLVAWAEIPVPDPESLGDD